MKLDMLGYLTRTQKNLQKSGDEVLLDCPVCNDKGKNNLWFNVKKNKGLCYKCSTSFSPVFLIRQLEGCSQVEALRVVKDYTFATAYNRHKVADALRSLMEDKQLAKNIQLPEIQLPDGYRSVCCALQESEPYPAYIKKRMSEDDALTYDIGWCTSGKFRGRVIVPIVQYGRLVSFVARYMGKSDRPYLYPVGCKTGRMLFNFDSASRYKHIVLVEGVFDAIRVGPQGMAILGSSLSESQLGMILSSKASSITLMFDPDKAGTKATLQSAEKLRPYYSSIQAVALPKGKDPDDFSHAALWQIIQAAPSISSVVSAIRAALDIQV